MLPLIVTFSTQVYLLYFILFLLAAAALCAIGLFAFSIWKRREYHTITLPKIDSDGDVIPEEEISAFDLSVVDSMPLSKDRYTDKLDDDYAFQKIERPAASYEPEEFQLPSLVDETLLSDETFTPTPRPLISDDDEDEADRLAMAYQQELMPSGEEPSNPFIDEAWVADYELPSVDTPVPYEDSENVNDFSLPADAIHSMEFDKISTDESGVASYSGKRRRAVPLDSPSL